MQELYRVLKPGGMAILQIPQELSRAVTFSDDTITDQKNALKYLDNMIMSIYGRDYFDKLRSIGFKVIEEDYTNKIVQKW
jgi:ubiquinone/menaquinone biosynthesis C-methylase UbiE